MPEFKPNKSRNASWKWITVQVNASLLFRASKLRTQNSENYKMHINPTFLDYRCSLHVFRDSHTNVGCRLFCGCLGSCQRTQLEFQAAMYSSPHYDLIAKNLARWKYFCWSCTSISHQCINMYFCIFSQQSLNFDNIYLQILGFDSMDALKNKSCTHQQLVNHSYFLMFFHNRE